ncbi:MAG: hypothetical protein CMJ34_02260 [Phycisphaerae bacterium]|nr:hypothetical protein [Phycisphaerae bacterium]
MLTQRLAGGAGLLLITSFFGRFLALLAQIVTGLVLSDGDFGIYAAAVGLQTFAGITRGGDAQTYLVTLPPTQRRFRVGTVFWISTSLYLLGIIPMLAVAPFVAERFEEPILVPLFWILSATLLTAPVRYVLQAKVNAHLEFRANAKGVFIADVTAYLLMVVLALTIRNPLALAIPILVGCLAQVLYLWKVARPRRTDFTPHRRFVVPVLYQLRWLIAVAAMMSLWTSGDYAVAEFLVPAAILGTYYFGYQLAVQPGRLFTTNLTNVLVPVVCRVMHEPERLRSAIRRLLGTGGFTIAIVNLGMFAVIASLEQLIWNGRWSDVVHPVQILSVGLIYSSILTIITSPFMAERKYLETFVCNAVRAGGIVGGAAIGASVGGGTVESIAAWVGGSMIATSLIAIFWITRRYGLDGFDAVRHLIRCTAPVIVAGLIAAVVDGRLLDLLGEGRTAGAITIACSGTVFLLLVSASLFVVPRETGRETWSIISSRIPRRSR